MVMQVYAEAAVAGAMEAYERRIGPANFEPPEVGPRHEVDLPVVPAGGEYPMGSRDRIRDLAIADGSWVGLHNYWKKGYCDNLRLLDLHVQSHQKWASRSYAMRARNLVQNCAFRDVYMEHGLYWNIAGYDNSQFETGTQPSLMVKRCLFENVGSQAMQFVQYGRDREYLNPAEAISPGGALLVRETLLQNCGYNRSGNARASFAMSFFRSDNDVDVAGVMVNNTGQATSRGNLLVEARGSLALSNTIFLSGNLQQPVAKIVGVNKVRVRALTSHAISGQNWLDIHNCPDVIIENCTGNTRIHMDQVDVGPIDGGFTS